VPKLPQVSGQAVVRLLEALGYRLVRQRGSHATLARPDPGGEHRVTVPMHRTVAKGTLSDILSQVATRVGVARDELLRRLR